MSFGPVAAAHESGASSADSSVAYLFMILSGPTYTAEDFRPLCELLSQRFAGEIWAFGSYDADLSIGRLRLRVVRECSRLRTVNFLRFAREVLRRARELRAAPPAPIVVTSYDPFKNGLLAVRVARILGAPFICEANGVYGSPDNFAHIRSGLWRRLRHAQARLVGSFVLRRADAVRLLFDAQLEDFASPSADTVVRCFFALSNIGQFFAGPEEPIILAAGFPFMVKGVDVLVSAFSSIAAQFPQWRLVLVGHRIPEELKARGLMHERIEAHPGIPQPQLARWMSRCAIFVLASRSEAMGRVLIEAAAAARCRVASRVGGIPTVIEHGHDGILVPKEDVAELARALARLMRDEDTRRRLGAAAQVRAATEFSPAAYLAHFTELIRATLAKAAAAQRRAA